jgi:hypothetical protein
MMSKIKMIASDLDGTLLLNGAENIPPEMAELIRELGRRGVIFTAASGRQYENLRRLFAPVADEIAYICYNGGFCIYRGEVIYEHFFDKALANEILSAVNRTDDSDGMASARGAELIAPLHTDLLHHMRDYIGADYRVVDDLTAIPEPFYKVAMYNDRQMLNAEHWDSLFGDRCSVVTSGTVWLDFIPFGVDKGVAFRKLMEYFGIAPGECAVFGDNDNDTAILESVGLPVVMQSAKPSMHRYGKRLAETVPAMLRRFLDEGLV